MQSNLVFFYGTLMSGFSRPGRMRLNQHLRPVGRGYIEGALFDLGLYPAAIPATDSRVWGEVYEMLDPGAVLPVLDLIEGHREDEPDASLYTRTETLVILEEDDEPLLAWVYFYNAPLGNAHRIESGDYREHLKWGSRAG